jgi:hypothetical protein
MQPFIYLHLQLRLEGTEVIHGSFLREVEAVPGEEVPLMLLAQIAGGTLVAYYDEALERDLHETLASSLGTIEFPDIDPLLDILKKWNVQFGVGHYKTYVFPSQPVIDGDVLCLSKEDQRVKAFGFDGFAEQVYVIEKEGKAVSACVSARENEICGEAWVYTAPEYRQQRLAQRVVSAWAGSLMRAGKVPFYSHKIENAASASLAGRLKLQPVFEEIAIALA